MFSYVFWLRFEPSITYVRNWWGDGVIQNVYSCVLGERVSRLISFMFLAAVLPYSVLFDL